MITKRLTPNAVHAWDDKQEFLGSYIYDLDNRAWLFYAAHERQTPKDKHEIAELLKRLAKEGRTPAPVMQRYLISADMEFEARGLEDAIEKMQKYLSLYGTPLTGGFVKVLGGTLNIYPLPEITNEKTIN